MKRKKASFFLWALILLGGLEYSFSQGFRNPPEGAASISQAGAFIAQCDDASAITHNPAGLVNVEGQQILTGNTFLLPVTSYKSAAFSSDKEFIPGYLPYFYYSGDLGTQDLRLGIGISSPYGQTIEWSYDSVRHWNYEVPYYSSMRMANFSPVIAYRITPEFSAGAGLNIYRSQLELNSIRAFPPPFPPGEVKEKIKADGTAVGGTLGLLYRKEGYSLGLRYKSGFNISHRGTYKIPGLSISEKASIGIEFPCIIGAGIAIHPNPDFKVEFDAEWYGYSSLENILVGMAGLGDLEMPKNWKDSYMLSLGTEFRKSSRLKLRAGAAYITSPVPPSTWEPSIPDADSFVISTGGEFTTPCGVFDLALGVNILTTIERGIPYEGKYASRGYFFSLGYKKNF